MRRLIIIIFGFCLIALIKYCLLKEQEPIFFSRFYKAEKSKLWVSLGLRVKSTLECTYLYFINKSLNIANVNVCNLKNSETREKWHLPKVVFGCHNLATLGFSLYSKFFPEIKSVKNWYMSAVAYFDYRVTWHKNHCGSLVRLVLVKLQFVKCILVQDLTKQKDSDLKPLLRPSLGWNLRPLNLSSGSRSYLIGFYCYLCKHYWPNCLCEINRSFSSIF